MKSLAAHGCNRRLVLPAALESFTVIAVVAEGGPTTIQMFLRRPNPVYWASTGPNCSVSYSNRALTEPFDSVPFGMPVTERLSETRKGAVNHAGRYHSHLPRLRSEERRVWKEGRSRW